MRILAVAAVLLVVGLATDPERPIYRCDARDEIVFQDAPCDADAEPVVLREEASFGQPAHGEDAEASPSAQPSRSQQRPRATPSPVARSSGPPRTARAAEQPSRSRQPRGTNACEHARQARELAYAARSNALTFDERRALQDSMDAACGLD